MDLVGPDNDLGVKPQVWYDLNRDYTSWLLRRLGFWFEAEGLLRTLLLWRSRRAPLIVLAILIAVPEGLLLVGFEKAAAIFAVIVTFYLCGVTTVLVSQWWRRYRTRMLRDGKLGGPFMYCGDPEWELLNKAFTEYDLTLLQVISNAKGNRAATPTIVDYLSRTRQWRAHLHRDDVPQVAVQALRAAILQVAQETAGNIARISGKAEI